MSPEEIQEKFNEHCNNLDLNSIAFTSLRFIIGNPENQIEDENFLSGYEKEELIERFEGFRLVVEPEIPPFIITRIGIYVKDEIDIWLNGLVPIGFYELHTDMAGEVIDDFFSIDKEKYIDDISINYHFQEMNKSLPADYLKRNHIQFDFVTYLSLVGTLFLSKKFDQSGLFICRALEELRNIKSEKIDADFLKHALGFLNITKKFLFRKRLLSDEIKKRLEEIVY